MLQTLLKIGEWQSRGKSKWERFLDYPKPEREDKYGNSIINQTLPIIFDLDANEVVISQDNLMEYDLEKVKITWPLKIKGGNNKAIYTAVPATKVNQIYKTFFGKEGAETEHGELYEAINKIKPALLTQNFKNLLSRIFQLKSKFLQGLVHTKKGKVDIRAVNEAFDLNKTEKIVFVVAQIKAREFGFNKPAFFSEVADNKTFLQHVYFGDLNSKTKKKPPKKLCYASGELMPEVGELNLDKRYSLNKMFVTETKNYASSFDEKKFHINYQVSGKNQGKLDYASDYLLNEGFKIRIANLEHLIIPQFRQNSRVDLEMALEGIKSKSDILFNMKRLDKFSLDIEDELENEIFWIHFLAFESDGNFFKTIEVIKDVSSFHFSKIINLLTEIDWEFRYSGFVDWDSAMSEYDNKTNKRLPTNLNFNSLYKIIPIRKGKQTKNKALELFKTILENRKVNEADLYKYFNELILCHYLQRYDGYLNLQRYKKDYFSLAVRDSVFKYHALIYFLKKLKLIDMDSTTRNATEQKPKNKFDEAISQFFSKMSLNPNQKAMFHLGRMLSSVESLQKDKVKTVIQQVNFNGMDKDSIQRLRCGLVEKAKQYHKLKKVIFEDEKFAKLFHYNQWNMNPMEALFFLLTGYTFWAKKKKAEADIQDSAEINENQETILTSQN